MNNSPKHKSVLKIDVEMIKKDIQVSLDAYKLATDELSKMTSDQRDEINKKTGEIQSLGDKIEELNRKLSKLLWKMYYPYVFIISCVIIVFTCLLVYGYKKIMNRLPVANPKPVVNTVTLRLHGSGTVGWYLAPKLIEGFLTKYKNYKNAHLNWSLVSRKRTANYPAPDGTLYVCEIDCSGSMFGIADLQSSDLDEHHCEIAMSSEKLPAIGNESLQTFTVGIDTIRVAVSSENRIKIIPKSMLKDIFLGKQRAWKESDSNIRTEPVIIQATRYGKNGSGTVSVLERLILDNLSMSNMLEGANTGEDLVIKTATKPGGVGFVSLDLLKNADRILQNPSQQAKKTLSVKPVDITDVPGWDDCFMKGDASDIEKIKSWKYYLTRPLYMIIDKNGPPISKEFIQFALSAEGQKIVKKEGFADLVLGEDVSDKHSKNIEVLPPPDFVEKAVTLRRLKTIEFEFQSVGSRTRANAQDFPFRITPRSRPNLRALALWLSCHDRVPTDIHLMGYFRGSDPTKSNQEQALVLSQYVYHSLQKILKHDWPPEFAYLKDGTEDWINCPSTLSLSFDGFDASSAPGQENIALVEVWVVEKGSE